MVGTTKEFRTLMYSVVNGAVVTHRLPFNANDPIGRLKLQKFIQRGFTFDDPRIKASTNTGLPQVIVTQEVDLGKPLAVSDVETIDSEPAEAVKANALNPEPAPVKKWKNMNAEERKAYQLAKRQV